MEKREKGLSNEDIAVIDRLIAYFKETKKEITNKVKNIESNCNYCIHFSEIDSETSWTRLFDNYIAFFYLIKKVNQLDINGDMKDILRELVDNIRNEEENIHMTIFLTHKCIDNFFNDIYNVFKAIHDFDATLNEFLRNQIPNCPEEIINSKDINIKLDYIRFNTSIDFDILKGLFNNPNLVNFFSMHTFKKKDGTLGYDGPINAFSLKGKYLDKDRKHSDFFSDMKYFGLPWLTDPNEFGLGIGSKPGVYRNDNKKVAFLNWMAQLSTIKPEFLNFYLTLFGKLHTCIDMCIKSCSSVWNYHQLIDNHCPAEKFNWAKKFSEFSEKNSDIKADLEKNVSCFPPNLIVAIKYLFNTGSYKFKKLDFTVNHIVFDNYFNMFLLGSIDERCDTLKIWLDELKKVKDLDIEDKIDVFLDAIAETYKKQTKSSQSGLINILNAHMQQLEDDEKETSRKGR